MTDQDNLTPWQRYKQNLGQTRPWDFLNPETEYVEQEVAESRFAICKDCPFFISLSGQCKKCGCIMHLKTKLAMAECPEHKW
jgi:hypothetical protein